MEYTECTWRRFNGTEQVPINGCEKLIKNSDLPRRKNQPSGRPWPQPRPQRRRPRSAETRGSEAAKIKKQVFLLLVFDCFLDLLDFSNFEVCLIVFDLLGGCLRS